MAILVLLRHGQSIWNKENRFTGWTDVDLSPLGIEESENAAKILLRTCHLGNGASLTAFNRGQSMDTSMGVWPPEPLWEIT